MCITNGSPEFHSFQKLYGFILGNSGPAMTYKAVEVIWISGMGRRAGIEGILRGPRGPKKHNFCGR